MVTVLTDTSVLDEAATVTVPLFCPEAGVTLSQSASQVIVQLVLESTVKLSVLLASGASAMDVVLTSNSG